MFLQLGGAVALGAALSLDSLLAGAGLGCTGIRVPVCSALAAGAAGGAAVGAAMLAGRLAQGVLPAGAATAVGGLLLMLVGAFKLFESSVKLLLQAAGGRRKLRFRLGGFGVLLDLYLVPALADADASASLSAKEAFLLGIVLALDGAGAGLGAGLAGAGSLAVALFCTLLGAAGLWVGAALGKGAARPALEPLGGLLLLLLGLSRLL